jgi:hypothetical protein
VCYPVCTCVFGGAGAPVTCDGSSIASAYGVLCVPHGDAAWQEGICRAITVVSPTRGGMAIDRGSFNAICACCVHKRLRFAKHVAATAALSPKKMKIKQQASCLQLHLSPCAFCCRFSMWYLLLAVHVVRFVGLKQVLIA